MNAATPQSSASKRVLIVVANPATSPVTGWPVGFWWAELTHPYATFVEAGYSIEIASPAGGRVEADSFSDPEDASGYSAHDFVSLGFKKSAAHARLLESTRRLDEVTPQDFDAIFLVGGQSPMVTFRGNRALSELFVRFFEAGRVCAAVCHATCVLLDARLSSGDLLVKGRTWTGFADSEERVADGFVGRRIQPFWIESEARKLVDTHFVVEQAFRSFAVRDGRLVTGQQQNSGAAAARLVVEALGKSSRLA